MATARPHLPNGLKYGLIALFVFFFGIAMVVSLFVGVVGWGPLVLGLIPVALLAIFSWRQLHKREEKETIEALRREARGEDVGLVARGRITDDRVR
jgi:membrane protein implicated in regulation of membrane protease activity